MSDLPRSQDELLARSQAILDCATTNLATIGLNVSELTALTSTLNTARERLAEYDGLVQQAKMSLVSKKSAQLELRKAIHRLQWKAKANPSLPAELAEGLGLPVAAPMGLMAASGAGFTVPLVTVDGTQRLLHKVQFREATTPSRRARPDGVQGVEVWMCMLPKDAIAPTSTDGMNYMGQTSASPFEVTFDAADAGKYAWYMVRWIITGGQPGHFADAVRKMIVA